MVNGAPIRLMVVRSVAKRRVSNHEAAEARLLCVQPILPPSPFGLRRTSRDAPPKPWRRRAPQDEVEQGATGSSIETTKFSSFVLRADWRRPPGTARSSRSHGAWRASPVGDFGQRCRFALI